MTMKQLVRLCALYNASVLTVFLIPGLLPWLGVAPPHSPLWLWLPSLFALFATIVLWFSADDLKRLGTFPYYNGIIRVTFAALAFALDFAGSAGALFGWVALFDLPLGLVCILGVPRASGRTHLQLLTNRPAGA